MTGDRAPVLPGRRLALAGGLALCALLLTAAEVITRGGVPAGGEAPRRTAEARIAATIDSLLPQFGIAPGSARTWKATAAGGPTGRTEQKVSVPPAFRSLEFNHALASAIARVGAGVVAVERSKDNSVTMHIVRGGMTIRSIRFVTQSGP